ncbi:MAG: B12-binding domain-containing radical SAM protein, partial [Planctomycetes bacterium]|nr:B12-binding domain-containing radical SAM protein [Planctomycetota bacterium]
AVQNLKKAGFHPRDLETYIMTGLPSQTLDEINQSADFVHQLGVKVRLCQYSPIPSTKLFDASCHQYDIDPTEPLLHNNTILSCLDPRITLADFQQFKEHIKNLNNALP